MRRFIKSFMSSGLACKRYMSLAAFTVLLSLPSLGLGASAKMMWVLASFADTELAAKEAMSAFELTGQITAVQEAKVGSQTWHRVLVTPAIDSSSEARLTSLLRSANYDQTWRVWLGEADVGHVTWFGGQPSDFPDPLDTSIETPLELIDDSGMLADLNATLNDRAAQPPQAARDAGLAASSRQAVDQRLAPDVDYHPIRLRARL